MQFSLTNMSPAQPQRIFPIHTRFPTRLRTIFCQLFKFPPLPHIDTNPPTYPHQSTYEPALIRLRTPRQSTHESALIRPRIRTNPPMYPHQSAHESALIRPRIRANPPTYPRLSTHESAPVRPRIRAGPYTYPHQSAHVSAPVRLWPDTNLLPHTYDAFHHFLYTELFVIY